jgi:hypothetical protein
MSPRPFPLAAALLLSAGALRAEDAAPAKADAVPPYELKNRSVFGKVDDFARAPFWPIGWVKRKNASGGEVQTPVAPKVLVDEKSFKVTSILIGSGTVPSLAVINGRSYGEGEFLRMPKGTAPAQRIRVQRINDGNVILQNADQTLVAMLHRQQLSAPKADEPLLDPER